MPFTKVSVDRVYKKTERPAEKKDRRVRQAADEIFPISFLLRLVGSTIPKNEKPPAKQFYLPQKDGELRE